MSLLVVDYGMGNLHSVRKALSRIGVESSVGSTPQEIAQAEKLLLPGVGHFSSAMKRLEDMNLVSALHQAVLERKAPILGICLGLQLLTKFSEEGDAEGLGWIDATVRRFQVEQGDVLRVPHTGWNTAVRKKESSLLAGTDESSEYYFVHAYYVELNDPNSALCETTYGRTFVSGVERGNIFGVQFHPEKSFDSGLRLLRNFAEM